MMGFDPDGWRMDDTVHPFATGVGGGDVRITTRWDETYFPTGLYGAMHECGHGLYEAGIPTGSRAARWAPASHWACTSRRAACGRTWSAAGARSAGCWRRGSPSCSAATLAGLEADALYRAVNRVKPSFIRVEADEATYALHIVLRFELEQAADRGHAGGQGSARGLERALQGVLRARGRPTTPTACSRTSTGRRG